MGRCAGVSVRGRAAIAPYRWPLAASLLAGLDGLGGSVSSARGRPAELQNGEVPDEISFRSDLYRGTAHDYDRFRVAYPAVMVDDLVGRAEASGRGRLLDLACGTGQITFSLMHHFEEVWAVDQERDMVQVVRQKARVAGVGHIWPIVSAAESLSAESESFELVAIGNAFHRLDREIVAVNAFGWLQPGRCVAVCWTSSPWQGEQDWQTSMSTILERWRTRTAAHDRIPEGWERVRKEHPDTAILKEAGFDVVGAYRFPTEHRWTISELVGLVYSTSFLPRAVLGDLAGSFEADLTAELGRYETSGVLPETIDFAYELARRPT
jgi:SAM-dependent methyltransferase